MNREPEVYQPLVTVVIATFNMARFLPLAIQSVLKQSYPALELIVVDDGSTDDTATAVEPFLADARVRYISQQNGGQGSAKNKGVELSRGEYIAFLDADDEWRADKLSRQVPLFTAGIGVVYSRYTEIDTAGHEIRTPTHTLYKGKVSGELLKFNFIGFGTSVVRRECFDRLGLFRAELGMGIDYDLWLRFSTQFEFDYVDAPLLKYRVWAGQMSKNCKKRYENGIQIMATFLEAHGSSVNDSVVAEAWAHTYQGLGWCLYATNGETLAALREFGRSLRYKPLYLPTWRSLLKMALGRTK